MDLAPIVARLQAQLAGFRQVGGAADLDAIGTGVVPIPSAFVMPVKETARPNGLLGVFEQQVVVEFGVVLVVSNLRDARGEAALTELPAARAQVDAALLGWAVDPQVGEPVGFVGGDLMRFDPGRLWWLDQYQFKTYRGRA